MPLEAGLINSPLIQLAVSRVVLIRHIQFLLRADERPRNEGPQVQSVTSRHVTSACGSKSPTASISQYRAQCRRLLTQRGAERNKKTATDRTRSVLQLKRCRANEPRNLQTDDTFFTSAWNRDSSRSNDDDGEVRQNSEMLTAIYSRPRHSTHHQHRHYHYHYATSDYRQRASSYDFFFSSRTPPRSRSHGYTPARSKFAGAR